jgi:cytochrome c-type biogenesis protein CcmH
MIGLWIAAACLAAGSAALILRGAARASATALADPTVAVYRRALAEIDDLAERDLIPTEERRAAKAEAGRRLLAAADRAEAPVNRHGRPGVLIAAAVIAPLLAVPIYLWVGSPGAKDQPFAGRLAQWRLHPELYQTPELAAALRAIAVERPGDIGPLRQLAALDMSLGDADGAAHALRKALAIAPNQPDLLAALGEILVVKGQGKVGPEAREIFEQALRGDPASPTALYYLGRASIADGDAPAGLERWSRLMGLLSPADPRRAVLAADIAGVQRTGRLAQAADTSPAPAAPMAGMIQGMVDTLAGRLKANPDDPDGWVRLVRAYTVLGEADKRDAALAEARRRYASQPTVLGQLDGATHAPPLGAQAR